LLRALREVSPGISACSPSLLLWIKVNNRDWHTSSTYIPPFVCPIPRSSNRLAVFHKDTPDGDFLGCQSLLSLMISSIRTQMDKIHHNERFSHPGEIVRILLIGLYIGLDHMSVLFIEKPDKTYSHSEDELKMRLSRKLQQRLE